MKFWFDVVLGLNYFILKEGFFGFLENFVILMIVIFMIFDFMRNVV